MHVLRSNTRNNTISVVKNFACLMDLLSRFKRNRLFSFAIVKVKRDDRLINLRTGRCAAILQTSEPSNYERGGRSRRNTVYCLSLRRIQRSNFGKLGSTCCPRMTLKSLSNYKSSVMRNRQRKVILSFPFKIHLFFLIWSIKMTISRDLMWNKIRIIIIFSGGHIYKSSLSWNEKYIYSQVNRYC